MNHCVVVTLDSLRWDVANEALSSMSALQGLGILERRHTYATWTLPSHMNLAAGLLPHDDDGQLAANVYAELWDDWRERLDLPEDALRDVAPEYSMPRRLGRLGYRCAALVAMPCLRAGSPFHRLGWHLFRSSETTLMEQARFVTGALEGFARGAPTFWLLNAGDTHYPYGRDGLPVLHGAGGAAREGNRAPPLTGAQMRDLWAAQVEACIGADAAVAELMGKLPSGTRLIITADHGELFGEEGRFGHGPFTHKKLLEVPYIEGVVL